MSLYKNWTILKHKLGPLETDELDPIQPHLGRLIEKTPVTESPIIRALIWTTMNCEEFYYQNTSLLVINHLDDLDTMCTLLNDHRNVVKWNDRLYKFSKLGEGTFGTVSSAKDKKTKKYYAVKDFKPPQSEDIVNLYYYIMSILTERNTLSELNKSPLFIKMIATYHLENDTGYRIITELCVGDLKGLISLYNPENLSSKTTLRHYKNETLLDRMKNLMSKRLHYKYHKLVSIYFFEMLSALYYLATKHVLHADIKLDNILISQLGHIKFADFGLALRNQWYEKPYLLNLESNPEILTSKTDKLNERSICGTPIYFDPEMIIGQQLENEVLQEKLAKTYIKNIYFKNLTDFKQNFMADLYAVGLTTFALIFGFLIQKFQFAMEKTSFWPIDFIYNESVRFNVLDSHLLKMTEHNDELTSIIKLLLSIFRPREIRCKGYTSSINIYKDGKLTSEKYIDINKVENILYYKSKHITKDSVINKSLKKVAATINRKIVKSINPTICDSNTCRNPQRFLKLHPLDFVTNNTK